jgi:hypothetical protein
MLTPSTSLAPRTNSVASRSPLDLLARADAAAAQSLNLTRTSAGAFETGGQTYEITKYVHLGPTGGDEPIRIGLFAGIHGDEPEGAEALVQFIELLEKTPEIARGYCLSIYPIVNPTGFEDGTRTSRNGKDLNREFWKHSGESEIEILEGEIRTSRFHGIVTLHSDDTSDGVYGFVRGATLTRYLLRPALAAAEAVLPRNHAEQIDGFPAVAGLIRDCYAGVLSAPPEARPRPFEIIFETPQRAPQFLQRHAFILALGSILTEYRKLISYAANI